MATTTKSPSAVHIAGSIALSALTLFLLVSTFKVYKETNEVGQAPRSRDTITIDGSGSISSKPDLADIDLGLYSEGSDVPTIQNENTQKVNSIIAALQQMGIAEEDIQTTNYNISPRYDYTDGAQRISGYAVSQNLHVKVRDLGEVGNVLAKAGSLGANQVNGVRFSVDDPTALKVQARAEAIADAREKADMLAKAMGVSIVRIVTFSESSSNAPTPPIYTFRAEDAVAQAPDIKPGSLDVEADISVTFEIR
ncbi:MAG TPA: SIMPL domain-containing protein [bacterium]|nr:SIMPL domain-containing protein [bacterium]